MIQKPNIKFLDRATISLKDTSLNSQFFQTEKLVPKIWIVGSAKIGQPVVVSENRP